jgi:hypothetical protein
MLSSNRFSTAYYETSICGFQNLPHDLNSRGDQFVVCVQ